MRRSEDFVLLLELSPEFLDLRGGPHVRERDGRMIRKDLQPAKLFHPFAERPDGSRGVRQVAARRFGAAEPSAFHRREALGKKCYSESVTVPSGRAVDNL
jgi:hypothetical protein